jgi:mercuric ion transport protein
MKNGASGAGWIGTVGATVSALCCLGTPALVSFVAALGLGFLINDTVLIPLLVGSLIVLLWGLTTGWRRHQRPAALMIGGAAASLLVVFSVVAPSRPIAYLAIVALVGASVLNALWMRRARVQH